MTEKERFHIQPLHKETISMEDIENQPHIFKRTSSDDKAHGSHKKTRQNTHTHKKKQTRTDNRETKSRFCIASRNLIQILQFNSTLLTSVIFVQIIHFF